MCVCVCVQYLSAPSVSISCCKMLIAVVVKACADKSVCVENLLLTSEQGAHTSQSPTFKELQHSPHSQ